MNTWAKHKRINKNEGQIDYPKFSYGHGLVLLKNLSSSCTDSSAFLCRWTGAHITALHSFQHTATIGISPLARSTDTLIGAAQ